MKKKKRGEALTAWACNTPYLVYSLVFFFPAPYLGTLAFCYRLEPHV